MDILYPIIIGIVAAFGTGLGVWFSYCGWSCFNAWWKKNEENDRFLLRHTLTR